ncbi:MAG: hypothetical protein LIP77_05945, partial [Planctomycetes bacterium]|nr:hypothetical protein [Planctomycetota bacterium]
EEMETLFHDLRGADADAFLRTFPFRAAWAMLLGRLDRPERAWQVLRVDAELARVRGARLPEHLVRTMVMLYERAVGLDTPAVARARDEMEALLETAFGRGYFRADDSYNRILSRYYLLGRYAVAREGREAGIRLLVRDGPYPEGIRDHSARRLAVTGADWEWLRIVPDLFYVNALERLDEDDSPELYDPATARILLEGVARAIVRGADLGAEVVGGETAIKADLVLSLLREDHAAFAAVLATVRELDYASLYDDAALVFGNQCGLVPLAEFPAWIADWHRFVPGRQHYFKAVYRALDKEYFEHALLLAAATAGYFPDDPLIAQEAEYVRQAVPELRARAEERRGRRGMPLQQIDRTP